jgi:hypothetical protein
VPDQTLTPFAAKEKLVQSSIFEATYHDSIIPMTPDMDPLIFIIGASISIIPFHTDFIGPIHPVQHIYIKGIASGLSTKGISVVSYSFYNDTGNSKP